jgi:hypothetical protein
MNSLTVYALGTELDRALSGATIAAVRRFPACITISLDGAPFPYAHLLSHRREPELALSDVEIAPAKSGIEEMAAARGRRITAVRALGLERVLVIELSSGSEWGEEEGLLLRVDLTPAAKPLSLYAAASGRTLAVVGARKAKRAEGAETALPARRYSILELPAGPPEDLVPREAGVPLPSSTPDHTRRWKGVRSTAEALSRAVGGVDPALAGVLAREKGGDLAALWPLLAEIAKRLATRTWSWRLYELPEEGEAGAAALYPVELPIEARGERMKDYLEANKARAGAFVMPSYIAYLRRRATARIGKDVKRLERLKANLDEDLENAKRSEDFRHYGELLVTYRHQLKAGMKEVVVRDFSGEREVTIPLDPAISIERNIRRYFTKAKKGEKGGAVIRARRREVERELARSRELETRIGALETAAELVELIPRERPPRIAERDEGPARRFRRYVLDATHTAWVGKSDADNDILTHDFASPNDLWFHAQGVSGSHVILKGSHRSTPASVIERAAAIAAYHSKARHSSTVPVIYTEKRYVRKPRKSKSGTALCTRGKTIFVKPELPDET